MNPATISNKYRLSAFAAMLKLCGFLAGWLVMTGCGTEVPKPRDASAYVLSTVKPPAPAREFRGAWIASVSNIDWPSRRDLTTEEQQAELIALLDRAAQLKLNAVIFQIRPGCDALYDSKIEPWSEYLTGRMGQAPEPYYDPLTLAVAAAHQRGLELHAWFNPYRARHPSGKGPVAASHISKTHPALVKRYGAYLWLDPSENAVQEHSLQVILDVVRRYDIDGVHLDDYFYPYPEKDAAGKPLPFPDASGWKRYQDGGGTLSREDWRRQNVNTFIHRLYREVKIEKPWVKVGISPFGIWRPGHPESIRGLDAYASLYADSRKWLTEGWLDYLAPQLYWNIDAPEQSYPVLLKWWAEQNTQNRHLWPGISISRIGPNRTAGEILRQLQITREQPGATGNILWSFKPLLQDRGGIAAALAGQAYQQPALVPASLWLKSAPPGAPRLRAREDSATGQIHLSWEPAAAGILSLWVLRTRLENQWQMEILPVERTSHVLSAPIKPDVIALAAVDRFGNPSPPAVLENAR